MVNIFGYSLCIWRSHVGVQSKRVNEEGKKEKKLEKQQEKSKIKGHMCNGKM